MADESNGDKTEAPTPKRRTEAQEQGNIARSPDLTASVLLMGGMFMLRWYGSGIFKVLGDTLRDMLGENSLPKVTTETGWKTDGTPAGDHVQGAMLMDVFLAQFKAGWAHTFIYEFADDSDGAFGFYKSDLTTPRKSAEYMHNFTSVLAESGTEFVPGTLAFSIPNEPATVHELLLQKSDGVFELVVWGEQVKGSNDITVEFGDSHSSVKSMGSPASCTRVL